MAASVLPVLVVRLSGFHPDCIVEIHAYQVGRGPSGLAAAVTLLRNGIPVRIIDKDSQSRTGQRATGVWVSLGLTSFELNAYTIPLQPRTFEAFHFLDIPEIYKRSTPIIPCRQYKPGTLEILKEFEVTKYVDPTPSVPYVSCLNFLA